MQAKEHILTTLAKKKKKDSGLMVKENQLQEREKLIKRKYGVAK
jgi:hypothetical protein